MLDQQHRHAAVAQLTEQGGEPLLFHVPQSRGRFIEQQQQRIDTQRARNLDDALLAERQASGQLVDLVAEADALECLRRCAPIATFSSTVIVRHQLDVLEGPGGASS